MTGRRKEKILTDFRKNIFRSFPKQGSSHLGFSGSDQRYLALACAFKWNLA